MITEGHKKRAVRYNRDAWLSAAMEVLSRDGQAKLNTDSLAKKLGVTRGSFYHHFKNRDEFVSALIEYWSNAFTERVNAAVETSGLEPDQRLLYLMRLIYQQKLDRYDIAFRSWAAQDSKVADEVRKVDMLRFSFVRSLFEEMGFTGLELDDRVRIWLVYQCAQSSVYLPEIEDMEATIRRHHAFFTANS